jgi:hypothetical protein
MRCVVVAHFSCIATFTVEPDEGRVMDNPTSQTFQICERTCQVSGWLRTCTPASQLGLGASCRRHATASPTDLPSPVEIMPPTLCIHIPKTANVPTCNPFDEFPLYQSPSSAGRKANRRAMSPGATDSRLTMSPRRLEVKDLHFFCPLMYLPITLS